MAGDTPNLTDFFRPRDVALVGASDVAIDKATRESTNMPTDNESRVAIVTGEGGGATLPP